jgi:hypothetical protein
MTTELSSPGPGRHAGADADAGPGLSPAEAAAWRWACCLHESGHLAYSVLECCQTPAYVVATAQAGLCASIRTASAWRAGVFAACGPIAEKLTAPRPERAAPPPAAWGFLPIQIRTAAAVLDVATGCVSDSEEIARAVVSGPFATCPDLWPGRYADMMTAARLFVESNAGAIVALARELFFRGALSGDTAAAILNNTPRRKDQ